MFNDEKYIAIIRKALEVSFRYKPKFGKGGKTGLTLQDFQNLYNQDSFYSWFGLSSPAFYAAHKAAGGITSVYRQIGTAMETIFREILRDSLGLSAEESKWSYSVPVSNSSKKRTLSLDGRIALKDIKNTKRKKLVGEWLSVAQKAVGDMSVHLKGIVFECRQGYKSKDSKRQNADVGNASSAYMYEYLPCVLVFSQQIDGDIVNRYKQARWLILTGSTLGTSIDSTYIFMKEVLQYDLAGFLERNSKIIQSDIENVLQKLLRKEMES